METAINTPKVSFEDFYEVPNLKFDIDRLRKDLEIILKEKKFNDTVKGLTIFVEEYKKDGKLKKIYINEKIDSNKSKV